MSGNFGKFDSFLKRVLPNSEYKEVKAYEPCVVLSSKKHAFRFTFLTNEKICITENPPKSVLLQLDLQDVVAVTLVQDKALFLQAELQEHVQHIVVKHYKTKRSTSSEMASEHSDLPSSASTIVQEPTASPSLLKISTQEDGPSTSNRVPMLCSYADIRTMDHLSRLEIDDAKVPEQTKTPARRIGTSRSSHIVRKVKGFSNSWQHHDPYLVHVVSSSHKTELEDLHLYILNEHATFHMMLKSVWRNYIVYRSYVKTLPTELSPNRHSPIARGSSKLNLQNEASFDQSTRVLFSGLRQELLLTEDVEHLFQLFYELKEASSNDILLKFLFWKDQALFDRAINLLIQFTKHSSTTLSERCDEIDLLIIILRCLGIMLREAEAIPQCYRVLQNLSQSRLSSVIDVLLQEPILYSKRWSFDDDVKSLFFERVTASSEVIYQMVISSEQVHWIINGTSDVFNATAFLGFVTDSSNLQCFLDELLKCCVATWSKPAKRRTTTNQSFNSEEAIDMFHMFTILHRIIARSTTVAQYARSAFQEEFRYYINPISAATRFPLSYPISGMARAVVHAIGLVISRK